MQGGGGKVGYVDLLESLGRSADPRLGTVVVNHNIPSVPEDSLKT